MVAYQSHTLMILVQVQSPLPILRGYHASEVAVMKRSSILQAERFDS